VKTTVPIMLAAMLALVLGAVAPAAAQTESGQAEPRQTPPPTSDPATSEGEEAVPVVPVLRVVGVVGEPQAMSGGAKRTLAAGDAVAIGDTLLIGETSRIAIAIGTTETPEARTDLLSIGANSKVELAAPAPAPGGAWEPPIVAVIHQGIYQTVIRGDSHRPMLKVRTAGRDVELGGSVLIGTMNPAAQSASYLVFADVIRIRMADRTIKVKAGMEREIVGDRVLGAKIVLRPKLEAAIGQTRIPGVDVTQPELVPTDDPAIAANRPKPAVETPAPYQYDPVTDQHWDPVHGHWHAGHPPPDKMPPPPAIEKKPELAATGTSPALGVSPKPASAPPPSGEDAVYVRVRTSKGEIVLELDRLRAPVTVANFVSYLNKNTYDGTIFHRVIPDFMIQGGGFTRDLVQKPTDPPIQNEWRNGLTNARGTIAMARLGGQPDSATSQFFINLVDNARLSAAQADGAGYAVFGRVVAGMDVVDAIARVATRGQGPHQNVPVDPVVIEKVELTERPAETP
jgi:cyclophilin family peptidyl-prolyl cis-trans isomerase